MSYDLSFSTAFFLGVAFCFVATRLYAAIVTRRLKKSTTNNSTFASKIERLLTPFAPLLSFTQKRSAYMLTSIAELGEEMSKLIARHELLTENLAAAIVIRDSKGKITYCSPYTEVLTGSSLEDIYTSEKDFFFETAHEEDRALYERAQKVTSCGEPYQFRYRFYHKTGILMWAETRTVPILDDQGNCVSSLSVTLDVTGTVLYQKQVEEKNRDLQDFTYMVSHDLKAPIYTIKGMAGIIEQDHKEGTELQEPLQHITQAAGRLEQLVASILEYSRISLQETKQDSVDTLAVIKEVLHDYSHQIKERNAIIEIDENIPSVLGDKIRVYQIFSNLLGNALKYHSPERQLKVNLVCERRPHKRRINIIVEDNGSGIPSDRIEGIFRPFQRVHDGTIDGSGIGLACVKKLVEKSGGYIEVESEEGKGSRFVVSMRESH